MRDPSGNWEAIAATQPYFGVLTDARFIGALTPETLAEFFRTGEADADFLLALVARNGGIESPRRVLDFGCGVGRLSLAFARRAESVTGVDVSPTMRALAGQHRDAAGLANVSFIDDVDALPDSAFDLVVSLIVFQHIPIGTGEELLRAILRKLSPGGSAAIHFTFSRPGGRLRRLARRLRATFPIVHRVAQRMAREPLRLPYMEMNEYDQARIVRIIENAGCRVSGIEPTNHGGVRGGIVTAMR